MQHPPQHGNQKLQHTQNTHHYMWLIGTKFCYKKNRKYKCVLHPKTSYIVARGRSSGFPAFPVAFPFRIAGTVAKRS